MSVCMYGCMDAWMYGCMDAWMHACMDGWMDVQIHVYIYNVCVWASVSNQSSETKRNYLLQGIRVLFPSPAVTGPSPALCLRFLPRALAVPQRLGWLGTIFFASGASKEKNGKNDGKKIDKWWENDGKMMGYWYSCSQKSAACRTRSV